jgi:hypothetical protein
MEMVHRLHTVSGLNAEPFSRGVCDRTELRGERICVNPRGTTIDSLWHLECPLGAIGSEVSVPDKAGAEQRSYDL